MLRRKITPTAQSHLGWIESTYGIAEEIDKWCWEVVERADSPNRPPTEVALEDVLSELDDLLACHPESDWKLSAQRFEEAGWLKRLRTIKVLVAKRTPPNKVRVNVKVFGGLSDKKLLVEVKAVYEIDLADGPAGTVTFLGFASYTPDNSANEMEASSDQGTEW